MVVKDVIEDILNAYNYALIENTSGYVTGTTNRTSRASYTYTFKAKHNLNGNEISISNLPYKEMLGELIKQIANELIKQTKQMKTVKIYAHKKHPDAVIPSVAYGNTSACFDLTCTETTTIPAKKSGIVPNGLSLTIDQQDKYWMQVQLRSSKGFKHDLIPHYGTVDAGYTGNLGVKVYNVGDTDITIEKGERYAQIAVIEKPDYEIIELNDEEFHKLESEQIRGKSGHGSSGK